MADPKTLQTELDWNFPRKVQQGDDGAYRWTYDTKAQGNSQPRKTMVFISAAVFVPIALIMLFMTWQYGELQALLFCLGLLAIGVGLPALIWVLLPPNPSFKMTEAYIESWPKGKGNNIHHYEGVRRVTMEPRVDRIRLKWAVTGLDVYVPREDYAFVRDYILERVPADAEKIY